MIFSDVEYALFKKELFGDSMDTIWSAMRADNFGKEILSYRERREYFLHFIYRLMSEGVIRISLADSLLCGDVDEQMSYLDDVFPKTLEEMEDNAFDGFWFLNDNYHFNIIWLRDNGHIT